MRAKPHPRTEQEINGMRANVLRGNRRRTLGLLAAITFNPLLALPLPARAAAAPANLSFRALRKGSRIGVHTVTFRNDGERLAGPTPLQIFIKKLALFSF